MGDLIPMRTKWTKAKRSQVIDEFGELQAKVDQFKTTRDRHEELRKTIASWYDDAPARQPYIEEGNLYSVQVSERRLERKITNMPRLFKVLGVETFLKLCSFTLAAIDASVDESQHQEFLDESRTGPRQIKPVRKMTPGKEAVAA